MLRPLLTFYYLFAVPTMAYRTPLRYTASSKTKIFVLDFGEALKSVLPLLPILPFAGQIFVVNQLTQSSTKDILAVQVESKSDLKALQIASSGEIKAAQAELKSDIKALQIASSGEIKAVLGELKSDIKALQIASSGEMKAVQEASIHRAELNSGEMKVLLATVTRLALLVENANARNLRDP